METTLILIEFIALVTCVGFILFTSFKTKDFKFLFSLFSFIIIVSLISYFFEKIMDWCMENSPWLFLLIIILLGIILLTIVILNEKRQFDENKNNKNFIEQKKKYYISELKSLIFALSIGFAIVGILILSFYIDNF